MTYIRKTETFVTKIEEHERSQTFEYDKSLSNKILE